VFSVEEDLRTAMDSGKENFFKLYAQGFKAFQGKELEQALVYFGLASKINPNDQPTTLFIERCRKGLERLALKES